MATPNRGYPELPGAVTPDVPYRVNLALREIDADVEQLDDALASATYETKAAASAAAAAGVSAAAAATKNTVQDARLAQLEGRAGFSGPGLSLTDEAINGVLADPAASFTKSLAGMFASSRTEDTTRRQAAQLADFRRLLRTGGAVTIAAKGDSLTYGYDIVSADRVPAPTTPAGDGTRSTVERSPRPWPAVLQDRLQDAYGAGKVTVLNRGFSGDTVLTAYDRWPESSGAGLTIFSLGTNDAGKLTLPQFVDGYERLILREINEFGAAVVILGALKQKSAAGNAALDAYRGAVAELGAKYGIPVIDSQTWLSGYPADYYSDGTHLTTKGYNVIGTRAAALFLGNGVMAPKSVADGSRLAVRPGLDGITYGPGAAISTGGSSGTMPEGLDGALGGPSIRASIGAAGLEESVYYSIYTETADLMVHLTYGVAAGSTVSLALDWGIPQGASIQSTLVDTPPAAAAPAPSTWTHSPPGLRNYNTISDDSRFLRIAHPGWHVLKVTGVGAVNLYAVEFLNHRALASTRRASAYVKPVPDSYDVSQDITSARLSWPAVMDRLNLTDWGEVYYHAPALKVTVRSFDHMVHEYLLTVNAGRDITATARPAIEALVPLRATPLRASPDTASVREVATVGFDEAKRELVFTFKTAGKSLRSNFNITISIL